MSDLEYQIWRDLIQQRCGLYFTENRASFMRRRLQERMRLLGVHSYSEYFHYVIHSPTGEGEWKELLESLLNLETGFFRHMPSFDALMGHMLPSLMRHKQDCGENRIAMWSAGCSIGAEPYSLVMAFLETVTANPPCNRQQGIPLDQEGWQLHVSGTDICQRSLEKARRGTYKPHEVRHMPDLYRDNYMTKIEGEQGILYQVDKQVRGLIKFGYLNLSDPEGYWIAAQDVIFCMNVLIYFKPDHRAEVVRHLCQQLNPGGYLVLAPAEAVGLKLPGVQSVRLKDSLVYQRIR